VSHVLLYVGQAVSLTVTAHLPCVFSCAFGEQRQCMIEVFTLDAAVLAALEAASANDPLYQKARAARAIAIAARALANVATLPIVLQPLLPVLLLLQ
jgi:hypothetical protein